jgi:hypothetical protein
LVRAALAILAIPPSLKRSDYYAGVLQGDDGHRRRWGQVCSPICLHIVIASASEAIQNAAAAKELDCFRAYRARIRRIRLAPGDDAADKGYM